MHGLSVSRSVVLSVTAVCPAKTAEPVKMPFAWGVDFGGPRNYVLDKGPEPPTGMGTF